MCPQNLSDIISGTIEENTLYHTHTHGYISGAVLFPSTQGVEIPIRIQSVP